MTPHGAAAGKGGVATCVALSCCEQVRATCKGCSTNCQQCPSPTVLVLFACRLLRPGSTKASGAGCCLYAVGARCECLKNAVLLSGKKKHLDCRHPVSATHECPAGGPEALPKTGGGMALVQTTEFRLFQLIGVSHKKWASRNWPLDCRLR